VRVDEFPDVVLETGAVYMLMVRALVPATGIPSAFLYFTTLSWFFALRLSLKRRVLAFFPISWQL
jgi:hypothetical protein